MPPGARRAPKAHTRAVPPASDYATLENLDAVPVRPEGKDRFAQYRRLRSPKAFVVYESGASRYWANAADAMSALLDGCAREGRKCWLYAVDNQVVWQQDVRRRIGSSDQLQPNP
jgi:hypothetical protein